MASSTESFADRVEEAIATKYGRGPAARVLGSWQRLREGRDFEEVLGGGAHPLMVQRATSYIDGLTVTPFHDARKQSWARHLEEHWEVVRDELAAATAASGADSLEARGNNVWAGAANATSAEAYGGDWKVRAYKRGARREKRTK